MSESTTKKRKASLPILIAGGVSSLVLALGMSPTFSAFTASILNDTNTAGSGTLTMQETTGATLICNSTDGGSVSTNTATCATINKYGGNLAMVPGQTVSTTINIKNTGTIAASSFSVTPGTCTQATNGTVNGTAVDLCAKINVVVTSGVTPVYTGTAAGFTTAVALAAPVAPGASVPFTFAVTLASSAGNTYQGLKVSQPITWTFQS
jgi:hypothetical protein